MFLRLKVSEEQNKYSLMKRINSILNFSWIIVLVFLVFIVFLQVGWAGIVRGSTEQNGNDKTDAQSYEMKLKTQKIKNRLQLTGKVGKEYVKNVLKNEDIKPGFEKITDGYYFATGKDGASVGIIEKGNYQVEADSVPGLDLTIPGVAEITSDVVIPIFVKKGSGKVEKSNLIKSENKDVKAVEVKIAVFADKSGNGNIDSEDKTLPLAGIMIRLIKATSQKEILLLTGWNLVTLTALPTKPITASGLLADISKQGGYATTVSALENGFWKSYVIRGDKTYSGEDFGIEPGKAYFVKAEKKSTFTFEGQNFAAPVKLKLASGWNAVGMPYTSKPYKAADLPVDTTARWESGLWDTLVKKQNENFGENFAIANNRGYLVKMEQGGEFSP